MTRANGTSGATGAVGAVGAVAVAALLLVGCSSPGTDKAGSDVVVLELATIDGEIDSSGYQVGPRTFVRALTEVSGGRIQVDVETTYGDEDAIAESRLVEAIAEGEVDGGWPATRAFAGAGIPGLAAVEAPMTITSYAAQRALAQGDAAGVVMASLEGTGVRGLGLAVGPLRRPFGIRSFPVSVGDWKGMRFRSYGSAVQTETIVALGGTAVQTGIGWQALAEAGELDGVELDVAQYVANGYARQAGKVASNVVLWPKMYVLSLNQERWDGMTDQQRGWVQTAADRAVDASVEADYPDDEIASQHCARGIRFKAADPAQLLAVREAVRPVISELAEDPDEVPLLREVRTAAHAHPQPDTITVQEPCATAADPSDASEIPTTLAPIPSGIYRKHLTADDVAAAGLSNNDGTSGTWTLEVTDGHWYVSCRPLSAPGVDCGRTVDDGVLDAGSFYGDDTTAWMVSEPAVLSRATGCALPAGEVDGRCHRPAPPALLTWSLEGDRLVFTGSQLSVGFETVLEPYERIG